MVVYSFIFEMKEQFLFLAFSHRAALCFNSCGRMRRRRVSSASQNSRLIEPLSAGGSCEWFSPGR